LAGVSISSDFVIASVSGAQTKAHRDLSDSLRALWIFVFTHVFTPKPVPTFGRHALTMPRRVAMRVWTQGRSVGKVIAWDARRRVPGERFVRRVVKAVIIQAWLIGAS
jgi:hypothetical protein